MDRPQLTLDGVDGCPQVGRRGVSFPPLSLSLFCLHVCAVLIACLAYNEGWREVITCRTVKKRETEWQWSVLFLSLSKKRKKEEPKQKEISFSGLFLG